MLVDRLKQSLSKQALQGVRSSDRQGGRRVRRETGLKQRDWFRHLETGKCDQRKVCESEAVRENRKLLIKM